MNLYEISKILANSNKDVIIFTSDFGIKTKNYKRYEIIDSISIYRTPKNNKFKIFSSIFWIIRTVLKIIKVHHKNRINIIHANCNITSICALILKIIFRIPYIREFHGFDAVCIGKLPLINKYLKPCSGFNLSKCQKCIGISSLKFILWQAINAFTIKSANRRIVVSNTVKKFLKHYFPKLEFLVVYNGINWNFNKLIELQNNKRFLRKNNDFTIIFVGNLIYMKGVQVILRSIPLIKNKIKNLKFKIIGDGKYKYNLMNLTQKLKISKNVIFLGRVDEEKKYEELLKGNLFINSSIFFESFCISNFEAMCTGLPIIASNLGANKEFIINGVNGYLYNYGDHKDLANKILWIYDNPKLLNKISVNNLNKAKKFSINAKMEKLLNIYKEILTKN